jgi:2,5-diketo-D-gluconate reductase A
LLDFCEQHRIALVAYSPLERSRTLDDPRLVEIATRLERTPAQVMLRWAIQRDVVVIPKSSHRDRIVSNARLFDFVLGPEDMLALDGLDRSGGTANAR